MTSLRGAPFYTRHSDVIHSLESWYKNSSRLDWKGEKVSQNKTPRYSLVCLVVVVAKKTILFQGLFWFHACEKKLQAEVLPSSGFVSLFNKSYHYHDWFYYHIHATHAHYLNAQKKYPKIVSYKKGQPTTMEIAPRPKEGKK